MIRTIFNNPDRYVKTYWSEIKGMYFAGDVAYKDKDGYFWIQGRTDDVLKVAGHRIGTAEVESALVTHESCAEAAVVGCPHEIKGQGIFAYVILNEGYEASDELIGELKNEVRHHIGPIATPDHILLAKALPKTRSGKIMRRILRKIAEGDISNLGDTSTLLDPSVVEEIITRAIK